VKHSSFYAGPRLLVHENRDPIRCGCSYPCAHLYLPLRVSIPSLRNRRLARVYSARLAVPRINALYKHDPDIISQSVEDVTASKLSCRSNSLIATRRPTCRSKRGLRTVCWFLRPCSADCCSCSALFSAMRRIPALAYLPTCSELQREPVCPADHAAGSRSYPLWCTSLPNTNTHCSISQVSNI
jgi:hypothetical protein